MLRHPDAPDTTTSTILRAIRGAGAGQRRAAGWARRVLRWTARLMSLGETMPVSWPPVTTRARPSAHSLSRGSRSLSCSSGWASTRFVGPAGHLGQRGGGPPVGRDAAYPVQGDQADRPTVLGQRQRRMPVGEQVVVDEVGDSHLAEAVCGCGVITSPTRTPGSALPSRACRSSTPAAPIRNQPISANQIPPTP